VSRAGNGADEAGLGVVERAVRRGAQEGRARDLAGARIDHLTPSRLHRPRERDHRRLADRCAIEAGHYAERRAAHGAQLAEGVRLHPRPVRGRGVHGFDISRPAATAVEAAQWLYFAYLAAVKEQNGAATSLGRTSTFLDIYFTRDLAEGTLTEERAQETIDDFVIKLRIVRFLRTPEHDELFAGDPTGVTESIGGMGDDGRAMVTKTSFRMLQTLYNLGPAPEPNLTVWYSPRLPDAFRRFSAQVAIDTSSIQFESDEIMRRTWGDDGAIACCVSPMAVGKQMQFFGARTNLAKCLRYSINGGRDEISGAQVAPAFEPVKADVLEFNDIIDRFERTMDWLAGVYVNAMNVIHYMHDKYACERIEMALHDYAPLRTMAFGMAGMSVVADSLSAIKYATVHVVRDERGLITDFRTEGAFPLFGNNDNRVDQLAVWVVSTFMHKLRQYPTYRNALHTQSILTITSNVVYGKGIRPMVAGAVTHSPLAHTRCAGETATASTRPLRRWRRSRIATRLTASRSRRAWCPRASGASLKTASPT
jgi:formate C-acetyltransferase